MSNLMSVIRPGDRVTIRTPQGNEVTGKAVMKGPSGWVLNLGGPHGRPGIATEENTILVKPARRSVASDIFAVTYQEYVVMTKTPMPRDKWEEQKKNKRHRDLLLGKKASGARILSTQDSQAVKGFLSSNKGVYLRGTPYKYGQKVQYQGTTWLVYDHEAKSGGPSTLVLVDPALRQMIQNVPQSLDTVVPDPSQLKEQAFNFGVQAFEAGVQRPFMDRLFRNFLEANHSSLANTLESSWVEGYRHAKSVNNPRQKVATGNIPADVERYVKDIKKSSPDYDDAKVWATAWSIFCKNKDPGSDHCTKAPSEYFKGASMNADQLEKDWQVKGKIWADLRSDKGQLETQIKIKAHKGEDFASLRNELKVLDDKIAQANKVHDKAFADWLNAVLDANPVPAKKSAAKAGLEKKSNLTPKMKAEIDADPELKEMYRKHPDWFEDAKDPAFEQLTREFSTWEVGDLMDAAHSVSPTMSPDARKAQTRYQELKKRNKRASRAQHFPTRDLPPVVKGVLKDLRYNKSDIAIETSAQYNTFYPGDDGSRGFFVGLNLATGEHKTIKGNFGGGFGAKNPVDIDTGSKPLPAGMVVIQGQEGNSTYATIVVNPSTMALLISSDAPIELTPQEKSALNMIRSYVSSYRKEEFSRSGLGEYGYTNPIVQSLAAKGLVLASPAGIRITTKGKNAA